MTVAQFVVTYISTSLAGFIASRAAVWYLLTRWIPSPERRKADEVFAICGWFGFALSTALSLMLFLDGYGFLAVELGIVGGHLVWPILMLIFAVIAFSGEWAIKKLDANLRCIFGKINE